MYSKDFSQGVSSPLFGMQADSKICYSAGRGKGSGEGPDKKGNMSEARIIKSLFDGLSPVRNDAALLALQQKYMRTWGEGGEGEGCDASRRQMHPKENRGVEEEKHSGHATSNILEVSSYILADTTRGVDTPYKHHPHPARGNDQRKIERHCGDKANAGNNENTSMLQDMLNVEYHAPAMYRGGAMTPGRQQQWSKTDLLAPTPAPAEEKACMRRLEQMQKRLLPMTPGDFALLGCESDSAAATLSDSSGAGAETTSLAAALGAEAFDSRAESLLSHLKAAQNPSLNPGTPTAPTAQGMTRKVLFAMDSPPTPPMPQRTEITPPAKDAWSGGGNSHGAEYQPLNRTPMPLQRSPRAQQLQSASKQLHSVLEMLSGVVDMAASLSVASPRAHTQSRRSTRKVCFGADVNMSSPVPFAAREAQDDEYDDAAAAVHSTEFAAAARSPQGQAATDEYALYVKPATWTPLKQAQSTGKRGNGKGSKPATPANKNRTGLEDRTDSGDLPCAEIARASSSTAAPRRKSLGPAVRTAARTPSKNGGGGGGGLRDTMISEPIPTPSRQTDVPSPFKAKTPLKRSPVNTNIGQHQCLDPAAVLSFHSRETRSESDSAFAFNSSVVASNAPDISMTTTAGDLSVLLDQPKAKLLVPPHHLSCDAAKYNIKMQDSVFDMSESPIPTSTRETSAKRVQHVTAVPAYVSPSASADSGDSDEENTVPLGDLIRQANMLALHKQAGAGAGVGAGTACKAKPSDTKRDEYLSSLNASKCRLSTNSARNYRENMADCDEILREIENGIV